MVFLVCQRTNAKEACDTIGYLQHLQALISGNIPDSNISEMASPRFDSECHL